MCVRSPLDPMLGDQLPLVSSLGAVALAAWSGGIGPSIAAAITGFLACALLFMPPRGPDRLALSKRLIEPHGGRITNESAEARAKAVASP